MKRYERYTLNVLDVIGKLSIIFLGTLGIIGAKFLIMFH